MISAGLQFVLLKFQGLLYVHSSFLAVHGRLTSKVCMIDNRLNLRVGSIEYVNVVEGLTGQYPVDPFDEDDERLLWKAPEQLRSPPVRPDKKCDIFAFAIIVQEILTWNTPYTAQFEQSVTELLTPGKIAKQVARLDLELPYRPYGDGPSECSPSMTSLVEQCWAPLPHDRPETAPILADLEKMDGISSGNFLEKMLARLANHAEELEELVRERSTDLVEERRRCEDILCEMLPRYKENLLPERSISLIAFTPTHQRIILDLDELR